MKDKLLTWLLGNAGMGLMILDPELKIVEINDWILVRAGIMHKDVIGKPVQDVFPEIVENNQMKYLEAALVGQPQVLAGRFHKYFLRLAYEGQAEATWMLQSTLIAPLMQDEGISVMITDITERTLQEERLSETIGELRKTNQRLQQSEQKYRELVESSDAIAWEYDAKTKAFTYISPAVEQILGFTPTEAGMPDFWQNNIHPEDRNRIEELISTLNAQHNKVEITYRFRAKSGEYLWLRDFVTIDRNKDPHHRRGFMFDVTQSREAEVKIQQSEALLRATLYSIGDAVITSDKHGLIRQMNQIAEKLTGWQESEAIGLPLGRVFVIKNEITGLPVESPADIVMREGKIVGLANHTVLANRYGDEIPIADAGAPITTADGEITGVVLVFRDQTEERNFLRKLAESEAKFRALVETSNDGISLLDLGGNILFANHGKAKMLGYNNPDDFKGVNVYSLLEQSERHKFIALAPAFQEQGFIPNTKTRVIRKDGSLLEVEINIQMIHDENGKPAYIMDTIRDISERAFAERERVHFNNLLKLVIKNIKGSVSVFDAAMNYIYVSDRYYDDFYLTGKNIIGLNHYDVFPDLPQYLRDVHQRALKGEAISGESEQFLHPNGSADWANWTCTPWYKADSSVGGIIIYIEIITERKLAEDKIKESEHHYRTLANSGGALIWTSGTDKLCNYFNEPWLRYTGRDLQQELGNGWTEGVHPDDLERCLNIYVSHFDRREPFSMEYRLRKANGEYGWILDVGSLRTDSRGNFMGYIGFCYDITERKRTELLQKVQYEIALSVYSAKSLEDLLDSIRTGLSEFLDSANFIVALYDHQKGTLRRLLFRDEKDTFDEWPVAQSLSGYVLQSGKSLLLRGDEVERFANDINVQLLGTLASSWLGVPIRIHGKLAGVMVVQSYENPDAYQPSDLAMMELIAIEAGLLIERQTMITELIEAKEKAEESDRLKSAFLANMSHEIRTPMNGILGFLDLLQEPELDENEKANYISIMNKSGQRLLDTINDIIEVSKIEAGEIQIKKEKVILKPFLDYYYDFFLPQVQEKDLQFQVVHCKSIPEALFTDKSKLNSILTNLIKNAIKFTVKGSIEFGCKSGDNDEILLYVKDTGRGIEPQKKNLIFHRFMQADPSLTRGHEGSGLGLAITKAYVDALGGRIWVDSKPGEGSCFNFTIPACKSEMKIALPDKNANLSMNEGQVPDKLRVLIVEDDDSGFTLLQILLKPYNCMISRCVTGHEAVEFCDAHPDTDLILMDIKLPDMDGLEATRLIRQFNKKVVIIAQTAFALSGDKEKALEAGCNGYVSKPIKKDNLLTLVHEYFKN